MSANCIKCVQPVNSRSIGIECGFCCQVFHIKCITLTKQQFDYIKSNGLFWKCDTCKNTINTAEGVNATSQLSGLQNELPNNNQITENNCSGCKMLPFLLDIIQKLTDTVNKLQEKINLMPTSQNSENLNDPEMVINEIAERQRKANNVIIYKLEENNDDCSRARETINLIAPDVDTKNIKVMRLGKVHNNNKIRPLKVILNNTEDSSKVIYNKKKLKNNMAYKVQLSFDLTNMQRNYLKSIIDEMSRRRNNGENLYIKYTNGKPTIAKIDMQKN